LSDCQIDFKSSIHQTDFIQLVEDEINNVEKESITHTIATEEFPP
ncbi:unnamed protein product, partial [Rotaria sp. Silwood2]